MIGAKAQLISYFNNPNSKKAMHYWVSAAFCLSVCQKAEPLHETIFSAACNFLNLQELNLQRGKINSSSNISHLYQSVLHLSLCQVRMRHFWFYSVILSTFWAIITYVFEYNQPFISFKAKYHLHLMQCD
jgi:hypothetical protein